jgi:hypothetical protein
MPAEIITRVLPGSLACDKVEVVQLPVGVFAAHTRTPSERRAPSCVAWKLPYEIYDLPW